MAAELEERDPELRDYLRTLSRRRWAIALCAFLAVATALAVSFAQTPIYKATAEILIEPRSGEQILNPGKTNNEAFNAQRQIDTELRLLESRTVVDGVEKKLGREPDISVQSAGETDVVLVTVSDSDAGQAANDANTYAKTYIEIRRQQNIEDIDAAAARVRAQVDDLQFQLAGLASDDPRREDLESQQTFYREQLDQLQIAAAVGELGGAQLVTRATAPENPSSPNPVRNALIALVLGLMLGVGLAFLREYLDDRIRTKDDLARAADLPVLGLVPAAVEWTKKGTAYLATVTNPDSPVAEAYRTARVSIQFLGAEEELRVLQVTSPGAGEGKTATVANLAVAFAQAGQRVVVVDCDLRRPRLHHFFDLDPEPGLTSVLLGQSKLGDAIRPVVGQPRLAALTSGATPTDPSELLLGSRTGELIRALTAHFDLVIVDSPPVLPVSDPLFIAALADATVVVVRAGSTTRRSLRRTLELLQQANASLVGTVLNAVGARTERYEYGYTPTYGRRSGYRARRGQSAPAGDNGEKARAPTRQQVPVDEPRA